MRLIILSILLTLANTTIAIGQSADYGSNTTVFDISSTEGKAYKLKITLPANYDQTRTYKVLYYFDAYWLSEIVLGSYAVLQLADNIDDLVLVGISLDGSLLDWNIQRTFDFTPSPYDMPVQQTAGIGSNAISLDENTTGGSKAFADFLETKVFEFVDVKHPNLDKHRGFLGHSFSGLFGFYVMQENPDLFADYILISPSLWWNKSERIKSELFQPLVKEGRPLKLHLSYGQDESKWICQSNNEMDTLLHGLSYDQLSFSFVPYLNANHNSILPRAIYDGLFYLYSK